MYIAPVQGEFVGSNPGCAISKAFKMVPVAVADQEGVLELNYFIFMGNFRKNVTKLRKRTPLSEFEPPIQKSWIRS